MEIERKFLVKEIPDVDNAKISIIEQYYISLVPEVRLRKKTSEIGEENYTLTVKSIDDFERVEVKTSISKIEYDRLKEYSMSKRLLKLRYDIPYENYIFEYDVYNGMDLRTVEIEFKTKEEARNFIPPDWFGKEVTYKPEYKNVNLALSRGDCID